MASNRKNSKNQPLRLQDPHLSREKTKYDNPLPSREFVLEILEKNGVPMHAEELAAVFPIYDHELDLFERRLRAMERAGQILINRKGEICVAQKLDLIPCRIRPPWPPGRPYCRCDRTCHHPPDCPYL